MSKRRGRWLRAAAAFLADLLAQHRRIVPREAQFRVRGIATQRAERFGPAGIVVQEDVPFVALD